MIKALALYKPDSGCDYHRIVLPFQYDNGLVDNKAFERKGDTLEDRIKVADLVVWNRDFPYGIEVAETLKKQYGFKVVVDLDDYWHLYPHHFLSSYYRKKKVPDTIIMNIRLADAVTVTTARLADKVREYNPNVHIIPNALPYGHGQFAFQNSASANPFRFIYAGQRSHLHDLQLIEGALKHIASKKSNHLGFILAGYNHQKEDTTMTWPKMESIMSAGGRMPNYSTILQQPLDSYMAVYEKADACLVPLEGNEFNSCKSNLKLLEAAVKRIPVICSQVSPYSDDYDAPVLWAKKARDWVDHIRYLSNNPSEARKLGDQLHSWATKKYNLFEWNKYRFDLYTHIINS